MQNVQFTGNWSYSGLSIHEQCPLRFKLSKIDRLPEPPRPLNNPLERGNRIHTTYELFVRGDSDTCASEANNDKPFLSLLRHARDLYADGKASVEENWWFDSDWMDCGREDVWLWSKVDLNVMDEPNETTIVVDYKSGKSAYKAIEHVQQTQLYSVAAALRQPWANTIVTELWYVDEGHVKSTTYSREQALSYLARFDMRAKRIYNDRTFRPNPNVSTCRYCPYSPRGTGACPVGV